MSATPSRRHFLAALAAAPVLAGTALAAPQAEFSSAVNVVSLLVTVRDKNGQFINALTEEDFTVAEDGHPQTITYFSRQYDLALTLGLLVDTSGSQLQVLGDELNASAKFFQQILRDGMDQAFLTAFDGRDYMLQNVTEVRAKLNNGLTILYNGVQNRRPIGGTILYDTLVDTSELIMKKYQGRKALVLLTDGEDTSSRTSIDRAVEACQRTDTVVYSIGLGDGLARGSFFLNQIAEKTGGRFFEANRKLTVEKIYQTIEEELRSQYNIGYAPPPPASPSSGSRKKPKSDDGYRRIKVTVNRPGLTARTREGYYAGG